MSIKAFMMQLQIAAFCEGKRFLQNKIITMFHSQVETSDQQRIITTFKKPDSIIRCIITTVAFGMGVDIPDIKFIMHWGPSSTIIEYWQEVGRAGRNGESAEAHLYIRPIDATHVEGPMKDFADKLLSNKLTCIRHFVLDHLCVGNMVLPSSPSKCISENKCQECQCECCLCCSLCREACSCRKKADTDCEMTEQLVVQ